MSTLLKLATLSGLASALVVRQDVAGTATVHAAEPSGTPQHLASGFIYGLRSNKDGTANNDIPAELIDGMGFNYCRAGGAQMADALGWVAGEYEGRFLSTLSNYRTSREYGARFTVLMHDLWGADSLQGEDFSYPGDDGDWTSYDDFLTQVFSDIVKNDMVDGLDIDIWNEPDGANFWNAPQEQYLATWNRTHHRIREDLPDVWITGPSTASPPTSGEGWWQNYVSYISETNTIPDQYSWHLLDPKRNMRESKDIFDAFRQQHDLPERPININEYAANNNEQSPAGAVFYISQLERYEAHGLRANWASGPLLQDLLSNLVVNDEGTYRPTGEWHLYQYYANEMQGERLAAIASEDELFEVYATRGASYDTTRILAAVRPVAGVQTYDVTVTGLREVGLSGDTVRVKTLKFEGPDRNTAIEGPVDLGIVEHQIVDDKLTFWLRADSVTTAYAFEIVE